MTNPMMEFQEETVHEIHEYTVLEASSTEFIQNLNHVDDNHAVIGNQYYAICGAPDLRLSKANVGNNAVFDFYLRLWFFEHMEEAELVARENSKNGRLLLVKQLPSKVMDVVLHGSIKQKKSIKVRCKYEIELSEHREKERKFDRDCHKYKMDKSFIMGDAPSSLSEIDRQTHGWLKKGLTALHEGQDRLNELLKKCEELEQRETEEEKVVAELNLIHAVVHTSQTYFLTEKPHEIFGGSDFVLESKQSIKDLYENKLVECSDGKHRTKADVWIKSPHRREYKGITFDPTGEAHKRGLYNIWRGFSVRSVKGKCDLFKEHIKKVICGNSLEYYKWVWKWLAKLIQKPHEIPEVALLLMGLQGTGKGVFAKAIGKLFGQHFLQLDSTERLLGNFNNHMKNAVYIFADESIWGGNRKDLGKLKAMISESTTTIEPKGKDVITIRNYRHFIFASNEEWPVALDPDDRRFLVLSVSSIHKEDYKYFGAIAKELENGGYEALLHDLLFEDITDFNPRVIPNNIEAFDVKLASCTSAEQYIFRALLSGCFDIGNATPCELWPEKIRPESVFTDYNIWCQNQNYSAFKICDARSFGKIFKKLIPSHEKKRPSTPTGTPRPEYYYLPSLALAKQDFQKVFKTGSEVWDL